MKTLVIYYSLDGNTRFVSETIADELGVALLELKPKEEKIKPYSFMKYIWGGRMVMMKEKPAINPIDVNLEDYEFIIIGTPVWAWDYTPTIATFFSQYELKNKKIALFCCHGGSMGKTLENMKKNLIGNEIISENNFREPLKGNKESNKQLIINWTKEIKTFTDK